MINQNELLFVVDENNNPLEPKSRKEVHEKGYWHRIAHIWILNSRKQFLCQQRTLLKDRYPGKWKSHFGGHVLAGKDYSESACIELQEELGLHRSREEIVFIQIHKSFKDREFEAIFYLFWNGRLKGLNLEKEEVEKVIWIPIVDIEKIFNEKDSAWVHHGYERKIIQLIKRKYPGVY